MAVESVVILVAMKVELLVVVKVELWVRWTVGYLVKMDSMLVDMMALWKVAWKVVPTVSHWVAQTVEKMAGE